tara:strand:- start:18209 stop:18541 length:333 start_codon:yes stop_codon:yes gene_type:complete
MKIYKRNKKREFIANKKTNLKLKDVGRIVLKEKEHLTIQINNKKNEVCAFDWGMYATSSINNRLKREGFKTFVVKNINKKIFIMLVDKKKIKNFMSYINKEKINIISELK